MVRRKASRKIIGMKNAVCHVGKLGDNWIGTTL